MLARDTEYHDLARVPRHSYVAFYLWLQAQADALVQAIAGASENYRKGYQANHNDIDWSAIEAQARTILTPEQFAVFTTMDPGPSRGGLLQTRMYMLIAQVGRREAEKTPRAPGK